MSFPRTRRTALRLAFRPRCESLERRDQPSVVTNTLDSGPGSLRQALNDAYAAGPDVITFDIPTSDPGYTGSYWSIQPLTALPAISTGSGYDAGDLVVDGTSQPGWAVGAPVIEINGALAGAGDTAIGIYGNDGLTADKVTIRGLVINRWGGNAINTYNASNLVIQGCYIGTDATGTTLANNSGDALTLNAVGGAVMTHDVLIGGPNLADRNVIVDNQQCGYMANAKDVTFLNNYFGTDKTGTVDLTTQTGFHVAYNINSANNVTFRNNVFAGFSFAALFVNGNAGPITIAGNKIGTDATGMAALPNSPYGLWFGGGAHDITIGGTTPADRNIISGNSALPDNGYGAAVEMQGTTSKIRVVGNYIGVAADGTTDLGNQYHGIEIFGSNVGTVIGGKNSLAEANLIAFNGSTYGEGVNVGGNGASVIGNIIGKNTGNGVGIAGPNNAQMTTSNNTVQGNYIGVLPDGTAFGNGGAGVNFANHFADPNSPTNNLVGGTAPGQGNVIAFNTVGVNVGGTASTGNAIRGNYISDNGGGIATTFGPAAPTLTAAMAGAATSVTGSITGAISTAYNVDFFASPAGGMQGKVFIGSSVVTTDGAGMGSFLLANLGFSVAGDAITATATDPAGNTSVFSAPAAALGAGLPASAKVTGTTINGGAAQRSRVTTVAVAFDQIVGFTAPVENAFQLYRQSDTALPVLSAAVNNTGPGTVVTLTFSGTNAVDFGSLANGRYTLVVKGTYVGNANGYLDGNGDGTGGDNYMLASAAAPAAPTNIWRLFGDSDGDNDVDTTDFAQFRTFYGGGTSIFDFDNDGDTDTTDFGAFRSAFGTGV